MATTTPNYGWTVPTSTDLVKDGATAIETLGDAIDASMNTALGTKKAGMVLLNTTSFSGVSSVSLPADSFTSTYTNYRILIDMSALTTGGNFTFRLRAAGSDLTTANYSSMIYYVASNNTSGIRAGNVNQTSWSAISSTAGSQIETLSVAIDLFTPKESVKTKYSGFFTSLDSAGASYYGYYAGGIFDAATSADSFSFILPSTGSGRVSVYGYNK
jgi:hypothetical protein